MATESKGNREASEEQDSPPAEAAPLRLVLANVGLDDTGAVLLAQAVQECGVTRRRLSLLDVFDNPLGDSGATALLEAVVACSQKVPQQQRVQLLPVERLDLGCTDIKIHEIKHLACPGPSKKRRKKLTFFFWGGDFSL